MCGALLWRYARRVTLVGCGMLQEKNGKPPIPAQAICSLLGLSKVPPRMHKGRQRGSARAMSQDPR